MPACYGASLRLAPGPYGTTNTPSIIYRLSASIIKETSMQAGLRPAHARVPAVGWHQDPTGLTKALQAYPQNFVTEPRTLRLLYIDPKDITR